MVIYIIRRLRYIYWPVRAVHGSRLAQKSRQRHILLLWIRMRRDARRSHALRGEVHLTISFTVRYLHILRRHRHLPVRIIQILLGRLIGSGCLNCGLHAVARMLP